MKSTASQGSRPLAMNPILTQTSSNTGRYPSRPVFPVPLNRLGPRRGRDVVGFLARRKRKKRDQTGDRAPGYEPNEHTSRFILYARTPEKPSGSFCMG